MPHQFPPGLLVTFSLCCLLQAAPCRGESYQFRYERLQRGDQANQQVDFDLDLVMNIEQDEQLVDSSRRQMRRKQQLRMTVLESAEGQTCKAKLTYDVAQQEINDEGERPIKAAQPVAGKSYIVSRADEKLVITDLEGRTPPPEELAIVTASSDAIGRPNPIAQFFHGRTVTVGKQLELPAHLARSLLGFGDKVAGVSKFTMTLTGVREVDGQRCGVFDTEFEAKIAQGATMTMNMKGQMLLGIDTCRAKAIAFSGPVSMSETRGPAGGQFMVNTKGTLKMALQAQHPRQRF